MWDDIKAKVKLQNWESGGAVHYGLLHFHFTEGDMVLIKGRREETSKSAVCLISSFFYSLIYPISYR